MIIKQKTVNRVVLLPIDDILPNPNQPRMVFEQDKLNELAMSISQYGLLQPITVQMYGKNQYQLVAGERRLMACKLLKLREIPAIITEMLQEDSAALALIENIQRCSLNYFEEAKAIDNLIRMLGETQQFVAKRLGKTQSTVANKLRLLKYPEEARKKLLEGQLTERHARALLPLAQDERLDDVLKTIVEKGLNVAETEQYVNQLLHQEKKPKPMRLFVVKDLRIFLNTIKKATETMKLSGIDAKTRVDEDEDSVVYTIRIPKKSAYQTPKKLPATKEA